MADDREDFDNVAWDKNDKAFEESKVFFRLVSTLRKIESFVEQELGKTATWVSPMRIGGYNNLYGMQIEGSKNDVMIRLPQLSLAQFPDEKTFREAAVANFIAQNTLVPLPPVLFYGVSDPDREIGPFTIIPFVENCGSMSRAIAMPNEKDPTEAHMLNPDIDEGLLEDFYTKIAVHQLELFEHKFPRIGSLSQTDEKTFLIEGRPITQNMNNMLQLANIPRAALPAEDKTYGTADEWYVELAKMHLAQLEFQHNDLVTTADDCRNKYIARQLFFKLAKQNRLSIFGFAEDRWSAQSKHQILSLPAPSGTDAFRLWCDDFRPSNILLDKTDNTVATIDWEFAYAALTQIFLDPPWWLLLNVPEIWHTDIDDWTGIFELRLRTWLRAMENAEECAGVDSEDLIMSKYMRESWETGRFWLNYAARKSWAFDTIFWKYLDERFFGIRKGSDEVLKQDLWRTRIHLLSEEERRKMESFVEGKMEESKERILVDWDDEQVKERLAQVLCEDDDFSLEDLENSVNLMS